MGQTFHSALERREAQLIEIETVATAVIALSALLIKKSVSIAAPRADRPAGGAERLRRVFARIARRHASSRRESHHRESATLPSSIMCGGRGQHRQHRRGRDTRSWVVVIVIAIARREGGAVGEALRGFWL